MSASTTTAPTNAQLAERAAAATGEAAQAQAELERRAAAAAADLVVRQRAWDEDLHAHHRERDAELEQQGKALDAALEAATATGDVQALYTAWVDYSANRVVRRQLRYAAEGAANRLGLDPSSTLPELRYYPVDLLDRLQAAAERAADNLGHDQADELTATRPTT